ncbi:dihydrolipoyllysine-residue acetyltransferase [Alteromonas sp. 345S023]|uniref:Dihydrolipoamide acetyltransferase component of pyruvate dehydrogenase complex n=1 Tax=Alteromonas profundi TaxID=2696062 RepID=A0A7X5RL40_9ALTE|nr:dihydrolipoyllysine-residue acetyltransferase [Alteromonas profundi]NDV91289.1 dihydrolipoyllysine-residue acetyltransferase [Alteromonas profundi]
MSIEFILPDIGEGIVECELLEWLVKEGDTIEEDQPVAEVMTDKATVQIPAMHAGTVTKLFYNEGDIAKVHAPLFEMQVAGETNFSESTDKPVPTQKEEASLSLPNASTNTHVEDFILPDIGEGIVECEIVKWNVQQGEEIVEDQSVVEVMTDKAVVEIPAKHSGIVHTLYYKQGDIAKVHSPLFALERAGEGAEQSHNNDSTTTKQNPVKKGDANSDKSNARIDTGKWQEGSFEAPVSIPGKVLASPAVRRIAQEHSIELASVKGSGKKGRILKKDLAELTQKTAHQSTNDVRNKQATNVEIAQSQALWSPSFAGESGKTRTEKVRGIQAAMAKQMSVSVFTIPHFSVSDELEMDNLIALRKTLKPAFEAQDVKLSFMPFFIKAMSLALNEFPIINSQLNDDADEITYFHDHNIGFAVDSKIGLLVPNIKQVQHCSLFDIAQQMQTIIEQARNGRVGNEHLKGGTISISNIGAIGGINAAPVINKPEAAIVALGKSQRLPRFDEKGEVIAKNIMMINWSGDHRIIDGATMVKFNNLWMSYLQQPEKMLMYLK